MNFVDERKKFCISEEEAEKGKEDEKRRKRRRRRRRSKKKKFAGEIARFTSVFCVME